MGYGKGAVVEIRAQIVELASVGIGRHSQVVGEKSPVEIVIQLFLECHLLSILSRGERYSPGFGRVSRGGFELIPSSV